jgi:hypothetical protein
VLASLPVRFTITSGANGREVEDQRGDARSAYKCAADLTSAKRPNVRIFDQDGHILSLEKLRRLADEEGVENR